MSGDPSLKEPVIFYSEQMTDAKIMLLELHGIKFKNKYSYNLSLIHISEPTRPY